MDEIRNSPVDFVPNAPEIALDRKIKRINSECERRILAIFSTQDQINILAACLAKIIGEAIDEDIRGVSSAAYFAARDRDRAGELLRVIMQHRQAAEALKVYCARNPALLGAIDVASEKHWPKRKAPSDEN